LHGDGRTDSKLQGLRLQKQQQKTGAASHTQTELPPMRRSPGSLSLTLHAAAAPRVGTGKKQPIGQRHHHQQHTDNNKRHDPNQSMSKMWCAQQEKADEMTEDQRRKM